MLMGAKPKRGKFYKAGSELLGSPRGHVGNVGRFNRFLSGAVVVSLSRIPLYALTLADARRAVPRKVRPQVLSWKEQNKRTRFPRSTQRTNMKTLKSTQLMAGAACKPVSPLDLFRVQAPVLCLKFMELYFVVAFLLVAIYTGKQISPTQQKPQMNRRLQP